MWISRTCRHRRTIYVNNPLLGIEYRAMISGILIAKSVWCLCRQDYCTAALSFFRLDFIGKHVFPYGVRMRAISSVDIKSIWGWLKVYEATEANELTFHGWYEMKSYHWYYTTVKSQFTLSQFNQSSNDPRSKFTLVTLSAPGQIEWCN